VQRGRLCVRGSTEGGGASYNNIREAKNKSTQASGTDNAKKLANAVKRHHLTASPKATIYTALVKRRRLCLPPQRFAFPRFVTAGDSCFLFFPPLDLLFFSPDTYTLRYIVFSLSSNIYHCLIYFYTKKR
jgi:hypothetical protein